MQFEPSKRQSPPSVATQTPPSGLTARACTNTSGRPLCVPQEVMLKSFVWPEVVPGSRRKRIGKTLRIDEIVRLVPTLCMKAGILFIDLCSLLGLVSWTYSVTLSKHTHICSRPRLSASTTACVRSETCNRERMSVMCDFTLTSLMFRASPISRLLLPATTRVST